MRKQNGNVLFMILIAVALFAALSYAVTQSTRSGGDAGSETNLISSAQIIQYPASIRMAVMRMMISNGLGVTELEFNLPSVFGSCTSGGGNCVFHPSGGGASYVTPPEELFVAGEKHEWGFTWISEVENVGQNAQNDFAGNDPIAFLIGLKQSICEKINEKLNISGIPSFSAVTLNKSTVESWMTLPRSMDAGWTGLGLDTDFGSLGGAEALIGQPQGCFITDDGFYVYYQVLIER